MSSLAAFAQSAFAQTDTEGQMNFLCDASADAQTYFWYNHGSNEAVWRCRQAPRRSGQPALSIAQVAEQQNKAMAR